MKHDAFGFLGFANGIFSSVTASLADRRVQFVLVLGLAYVTYTQAHYIPKGFVDPDDHRNAIEQGRLLLGDMFDACHTLYSAKLWCVAETLEKDFIGMLDEQKGVLCRWGPNMGPLCDQLFDAEKAGNSYLQPIVDPVLRQLPPPPKLFGYDGKPCEDYSSAISALLEGGVSMFETCKAFLKTPDAANLGMRNVDFFYPIKPLILK